MRLHALIFAFALAARLALAAVFVGLGAPPKGEANPDQLEYEAFAHHLAAGEGYVLEPGVPTACRPPGTAFVLAPVYLVFGRSFLAARVWWCVLSAACVPLAGWIGHRLAGLRAGLLAAAWLAVYPGHAYYAAHFLSETPTTLLTAAAVALHLVALRRPPGWVDAALGLVWGFGILTRPNLAVAAGLAGLLVLFVGGLPLRQRAIKAFLLGAAAALVVLPWVGRTAAVAGKPGLCTIVGGYTFWGAYNPRTAAGPDVGYWVSASSLMDTDHPLSGTEAEREDAAWGYGKAFVREHSDALPGMKLHAVGRLVWAYPEAGNRTLDLAFRGAWLLSLPFVLVGMWRLRTRWEAVHVLPPLAAVLATAVVFYGCARFRDAAAPVLAVFAGAGLAAAAGRVFRTGY